MFRNPGGGPLDFREEVLENYDTLGLSYKLVYCLKPICFIL
jgi:hypothetical protein